MLIINACSFPHFGLVLGKEIGKRVGQSFLTFFPKLSLLLGKKLTALLELRIYRTGSASRSAHPSGKKGFDSFDVRGLHSFTTGYEKKFQRHPQRCPAIL